MSVEGGVGGDLAGGAAGPADAVAAVGLGVPALEGVAVAPGLGGLADAFVGPDALGGGRRTEGAVGLGDGAAVGVEGHGAVARAVHVDVHSLIFNSLAHWFTVWCILSLG